MYAVRKFHFYLYGHKFSLITDHKPLLGLFSTDRPISVLASGRIQRWCLMLHSDEFKLFHKSGKYLRNADALSRVPMKSETDPCVPVPAEWIHLTRLLDETPVTAKLISTETQKCEVLSQVRKNVVQGWPESSKNLPEAVVPYFRHSRELNCI